jgi:protein-S-isoprenylcysteine O-methyltransferase Ste14
MNLVNTEIVEDAKSKTSNKQIFVASFNGENNILMECQNAEDMKLWTNAIRTHIDYANNVSDLRASNRFPAVAENPPVLSMDSSKKSVESDDANPVEQNPPAKQQEPVVQTTVQPAELPVSLDITEICTNVIDFASHLAADSEFRTKLVLGWKTSLQSALKGMLSSWTEGQLGERGEKILVSALLLFAMILFGRIPIFYRLLALVLKVLATSMICVGLSMVVSAVMELKENMSLVLTPCSKNSIVRTGLYAYVRHPMYGGVVLFAFGRAIIADHAFQVLLALALSMLLVSHL